MSLVLPNDSLFWKTAGGKVFVCNDLVFIILGWLTVEEQCLFQGVCEWIRAVVGMVGLNIPTFQSCILSDECIEYLQKRIWLLKRVEALQTDFIPDDLVVNLLYSRCKIKTLVIFNIKPVILYNLKEQSRHVLGLKVCNLKYSKNNLLMQDFSQILMQYFSMNLLILDVSPLYVNKTMLLYLLNCNLIVLHINKVEWMFPALLPDVDRFNMKHIADVDLSCLSFNKNWQIHYVIRWCAALLTNHLLKTVVLPDWITAEFNTYLFGITNRRCHVIDITNVPLTSDMIPILLFDIHQIKNLIGFVTADTTKNVYISLLKSGITKIIIDKFNPTSDVAILVEAMKDILNELPDVMPLMILRNLTWTAPVELPDVLTDNGSFECDFKKPKKKIIVI